jgi:hypothetical protein
MISVDQARPLTVSTHRGAQGPHCSLQYRAGPAQPRDEHAGERGRHRARRPRSLRSGLWARYGELPQQKDTIQMPWLRQQTWDTEGVQARTCARLDNVQVPERLPSTWCLACLPRTRPHQGEAHASICPGRLQVTHGPWERPATRVKPCLAAARTSAARAMQRSRVRRGGECRHERGAVEAEQSLFAAGRCFRSCGQAVV